MPTDRRTERHWDRHYKTLTNRDTDADRQTERHWDRHYKTLTNRDTDADRQTDGQNDTGTDKHTHNVLLFAPGDHVQLTISVRKPTLSFVSRSFQSEALQT
jgi:hypothetical protein